MNSMGNIGREVCEGTVGCEGSVARLEQGAQDSEGNTAGVHREDGMGREGTVSSVGRGGVRWYRRQRWQTGAAWTEQGNVWCDGSKGRPRQHGQSRALWGGTAARALVPEAEPVLSPAPAAVNVPSTLLPSCESQGNWDGMEPPPLPAIPV